MRKPKENCMLRRMLKGQKGFSLIEGMVAMGITAAAGVAYMTHMQTASKNESLLRVKQTITQLENQAIDYLKSRDICNENMFKAFAGSILNVESLDGSDDHPMLLSKAIPDGQGGIKQIPIFEPDTEYEAGKLWVKGVKLQTSQYSVFAT
jgi:type II secretory pathway pseudopilin PulG